MLTKFTAWGWFLGHDSMVRGEMVLHDWSCEMCQWSLLCQIDGFPIWNNIIPTINVKISPASAMATQPAQLVFA